MLNDRPVFLGRSGCEKTVLKKRTFHDIIKQINVFGEQTNCVCVKKLVFSEIVFGSRRAEKKQRAREVFFNTVNFLGNNRTVFIRESRFLTRMSFDGDGQAKQPARERFFNEVNFFRSNRTVFIRES